MEALALVAKASSRHSLYKGVTLYKPTSKWRAQISHGGRTVTLGDYNTEEEAARIFDRACICKYGMDAVCNFPVDDYKEEWEELCATTVPALLLKFKEERQRNKASRGRGGAGGAPSVGDAEASPPLQPPGGAMPPPPPLLPLYRQLPKVAPKKRGGQQRVSPQPKVPPQSPAWQNGLPLAATAAAAANGLSFDEQELDTARARAQTSDPRQPGSHERPRMAAPPTPDSPFGTQMHANFQPFPPPGAHLPAASPPQHLPRRHHNHHNDHNRLAAAAGEPEAAPGNPGNAAAGYNLHTLDGVAASPAANRRRFVRAASPTAAAATGGGDGSPPIPLARTTSSPYLERGAPLLRFVSLPAVPDWRLPEASMREVAAAASAAAVAEVPQQRWNDAAPPPHRQQSSRYLTAWRRTAPMDSTPANGFGPDEPWEGRSAFVAASREAAVGGSAVATELASAAPRRRAVLTVPADRRRAPPPPPVGGDFRADARRGGENYSDVLPYDTDGFSYIPRHVYGDQDVPADASGSPPSPLSLQPQRRTAVKRSPQEALAGEEGGHAGAAPQEARAARDGYEFGYGPSPSYGQPAAKRLRAAPPPALVPRGAGMHRLGPLGIDIRMAAAQEEEQEEEQEAQEEQEDNRVWRAANGRSSSGGGGVATAGAVRCYSPPKHWPALPELSVSYRNAGGAAATHVASSRTQSWEPHPPRREQRMYVPAEAAAAAPPPARRLTATRASAAGAAAQPPPLSLANHAQRGMVGMEELQMILLEALLRREEQLLLQQQQRQEQQQYRRLQQQEALAQLAEAIGLRPLLAGDTLNLLEELAVEAAGADRLAAWYGGAGGADDGADASAFASGAGGGQAQKRPTRTASGGEERADGGAFVSPPPLQPLASHPPSPQQQPLRLRPSSGGGGMQTLHRQLSAAAAVAAPPGSPTSSSSGGGGGTRDVRFLADAQMPLATATAAAAVGRSHPLPMAAPRLPLPRHSVAGMDLELSRRPDAAAAAGCSTALMRGHQSPSAGQPAGRAAVAAGHPEPAKWRLPLGFGYERAPAAALHLTLSRDMELEYGGPGGSGGGSGGDGSIEVPLVLRVPVNKPHQQVLGMLQLGGSGGGGFPHHQPKQVVVHAQGGFHEMRGGGGAAAAAAKARRIQLVDESERM